MHSKLVTKEEEEEEGRRVELERRRETKGQIIVMPSCRAEK